ncbi:hypothetical protein RND81_02G219800 [Saponaria officinalis]|uniref:F-box domain-containing protein n=1 Tax=Saponaria officinalis TaxID=3572 RepID=A0AAW1MWT9_SAPOF
MKNRVTKYKCTKTFHFKRCKCKAKHRHMKLPDELWVEILSKLPIKSLVKTRIVSSSWNLMASHISNKTRHLPQCGLLLGSPNIYLCLKTKTITYSQLEDPSDDVVFDSGYEDGCLGGLSFNFSVLLEVEPLNPDSREVYLIFSIVHRGLQLIVLDNGAHHVHNPATNEVFVIPKSRNVEKFGIEKDPSLVIRAFEGLGVEYSGFTVVRFFK